jgi:hypothetical protein
VRGSSKTLRYRIPSRQRRQDARFRPRVAEIQGDERLHPPRVKLTSASRVVTYRHAARFTDRVRLCFIRTPCRASSRDNSSFTEIARKVTTPITVDGAPNRYRGRGRRIAAEPDHLTPAIGIKNTRPASRSLSGIVSEGRTRATIESPRRRAKPDAKLRLDRDRPNGFIRRLRREAQGRTEPSPGGSFSSSPLRHDDSS